MEKMATTDDENEIKWPEKNVKVDWQNVKVDRQKTDMPEVDRACVKKALCEIDNCSETYGGEKYRYLSSYSFDEHYCTAANPTAKSYIKKTFSKTLQGKIQTIAVHQNLNWKLLTGKSHLWTEKLKKRSSLITINPV